MSSDPKPASLRDLYNTPSSSWNFAPQNRAAVSGAPSSSAGLNTPVIAPAAVGVMSTSPGVKNLQWGSAGNGSSTFIPSSGAGGPSSFTGSSYASGSYPYGTAAYGGVGYSSRAPRVVLKALLASAFLQYTTTAVAMPWEVGKVLLQVQYVPKRLEDDIPEEFDLELELELEEEEDNDELSESSTDDSYFHDPTSPTKQSRQARARPLAPPRKLSNAATRMHSSPLVISYGQADGVWGMMKRVGRWRTEGWSSLWKGLLTSVTISLLTSTIQPSVAAFLRPLLPPHSSRTSPLLLPLVSHIITGVIISPLDTLRTVQIIHPKPSPSPLTHFSLLATSSKGETPVTLGTLYTHPTLLYPTLLDCTIRPLISLLMPRLIERVTGVRIGVNVWMYPLCEFVGGVIGLGFTIPVETIRRRLQAQIVVHGLPGTSSTERNVHRSTEDGRISSCVHMTPRPYKGILDCFWRILTEERSGAPSRSRRKASRKNSVPSTSTATTPKPRKGKGKPRLSGGTSKRDVRTVFDAETAPGHRPRMLSEEMRASERKVSQYRAPTQDDASLGEKVEQEYEKAKAEIEREGLENWIEGTGIGQLYRGFGMGVGALVLVLVLGLITGEESEGWAEL